MSLSKAERGALRMTAPPMIAALLVVIALRLSRALEGDWWSVGVIVSYVWLIYCALLMWKAAGNSSQGQTA